MTNYCIPSLLIPSVLWHCWLGSRKGIRPVKKQWWGAGVVISLERGADLHMAQLMPQPLTVSCFSKIQIGFTFLVLAQPGSPGKRAVKWVCVFVTNYCIGLQNYRIRDWNNRIGLLQVRLQTTCEVDNHVMSLQWVQCRNSHVRCSRADLLYSNQTFFDLNQIFNFFVQAGNIRGQPRVDGAINDKD